MKMIFAIKCIFQLIGLGGGCLMIAALITFILGALYHRVTDREVIDGLLTVIVIAMAAGLVLLLVGAVVSSII